MPYWSTPRAAPLLLHECASYLTRARRSPCGTRWPRTRWKLRSSEGAALKNGDLLDAAEHAGFEVLVTTDLNLKYQQNLTSRRMAIVVLSSTSWPRMQRVLPTIARAVDGAFEGSYTEVPIP